MHIASIVMGYTVDEPFVCGQAFCGFEDECAEPFGGTVSSGFDIEENEDKFCARKLTLKSISQKSNTQRILRRRQRRA
jgi:hypothetical protein